MTNDGDTWRSRAGWFTLVDSPLGLSVLEVNAKETSLVRALGGTLWDREGYNAEMLTRYKNVPDKKFIQFKRYRLFVPRRMCECQYTGWKPYDDKL